LAKGLARLLETARREFDGNREAAKASLEHFPFSVNRRDSQRAANKILWSSQAEEAGNGVFE
jgi:hypothetical protein